MSDGVEVGPVTGAPMDLPPGQVLCLLTHPYADHPDFRPGWHLEAPEQS